MLPKMGKRFPNRDGKGSAGLSYPKAIAAALGGELGETHQAIKIVMRWTGAGERSAKNWLGGTRGPTGEHLLSLVRHSDAVLNALAEIAVTQVGEILCMGPHRVACGDSTDSATVRALLENAVRPILMVTDPPYGVEYDPAWRNERGLSSSKRVGKVENDHRADWREAWALFPGDVAYVWHGALHSRPVAESLTPRGFTIRAQIIWAKDRLGHRPRGLSLAARALLVRGSRRVIGPATASRPRCGKSPAAARTPTPSTVRRSRSSA